jgi:hypothetical protein
MILCCTAAFFVGAMPGMLNWLEGAAHTADTTGVTGSGPGSSPGNGGAGGKIDLPADSGNMNPNVNPNAAPKTTNPDGSINGCPGVTNVFVGSGGVSEVRGCGVVQNGDVWDPNWKPPAGSSPGPGQGGRPS